MGRGSAAPACRGSPPAGACTAVVPCRCGQPQPASCPASHPRTPHHLPTEKHHPEGRQQPAGTNTQHATSSPQPATNKHPNAAHGRSPTAPTHMPHPPPATPPTARQPGRPAGRPQQSRVSTRKITTDTSLAWPRRECTPPTVMPAAPTSRKRRTAHRAPPRTEGSGWWLLQPTTFCRRRTGTHTRGDAPASETRPVEGQPTQR